MAVALDGCRIGALHRARCCMSYPLIPATHVDGAPEPRRRFRFMEIVRRKLQERRYSKRTQEAYVHWIRRFIHYHGRRHPQTLGEPEVSAFLSSLAVECQVAASTQKQALSALVFLYDRVLQRPLGKLGDFVPVHVASSVPTVLSQREVSALLRELAPTHQLCAEVMHGSGLRVTECVAIRVKDVDLDRRAIIVRAGKGARTVAHRSPSEPYPRFGATYRARVCNSTMTCVVTFARRCSTARCRENTLTRTATGGGGTCLPRRARYWTTLACAAVIISMRLCCSVPCQRPLVVQG